MDSTTTQTVITVVSSVIATGLLSSILSYVVSTNKKIQDIMIENARHNAIIENHQAQFRDLWNKLEQIDKHLENTDLRIERLKRA